MKKYYGQKIGDKSGQSNFDKRFWLILSYLITTVHTKNFVRIYFELHNFELHTHRTLLHIHKMYERQLNFRRSVYLHEWFREQ